MSSMLMIKTPSLKQFKFPITISQNQCTAITTICFGDHSLMCPISICGKIIYLLQVRAGPPHALRGVTVYLRGLHRSRFNDHLDLVLGAGQQLDGPGLTEPGAVGFKEHRAVVGEHLQGNPNFDDLRHVGHAAAERAQSTIEQVSISGRGNERAHSTSSAGCNPAQSTALA